MSPVRNEAGVVIGASKIARDITERKASDLAIRRLAAAVMSSDDAIVTKTLDGIITSWNPAAERIFGYTAAEALGQSIRILIPEELQGEEDVVIGRIRAGETVDHYETTRRAKDGRLIAISLTVSPIRDDSGAIVGASKIARDISEQQRLRAQAHQHARNTEKLSEVGVLLASALEREQIVQKVTDAATELTGAQFGAFFYNVRTAATGDAYMLYALAGAPQGSLRQFSTSARDRGLRADLSWRWSGAPRGRHRGSPLRPQRAVLRDAAWPSHRPQLPGGSRQGAQPGGAGRPVLRSLVAPACSRPSTSASR